MEDKKEKVENTEEEKKENPTNEVIDEDVVEKDEPVEEIEDKQEDNKEVDNKEVDNKEVDNKEVDNNETDELKSQLVRLQADFSNYKKRIEKEKEGYVELGVKKLALDLLPVLDNLERALLSISEYAQDNEIFKGINMIDDQIIEVLNKNNINEIQAQGEKFDPNLHHAVAIVEDSDLGEDVVVDVLQKGYKIKDNVIRPAMVRVSK